MKREKFPSPEELARVIRELVSDAELVAPMYRRLHALGLDQPRSSDVPHLGSQNLRPDGSATGYVPELAIESGRAKRARESARWVAKQIQDAAQTMFVVRQGLEAHVGPGPGYRQPQTLGSDAFISLEELGSSLIKQAERLHRGEE